MSKTARYVFQGLSIANLCWRTFGGQRFAKIPLKLVEGGVYSVQLPAGGKDDLEYYVQVEAVGSGPVYFPAMAPECNQTVVRYVVAAP